MEKIVANEKLTMVEIGEKINKFRRFDEALHKIVFSQTQIKGNVVRVCKTYVDCEVQKVLKGIEIDEINRGSLSVRLAGLKNAGFTDFYKVYKGGLASKLAKIKGVSQENAFAIKKLVYDAEKKIRESVVPRFDWHKRNKHMEELLKSLYVYKHSQQPIQQASDLYEKFHSEITECCEKSLILTQKFKLIFTSKQRKNLAVESFNRLLEFETDGFFENAGYAIDCMAEIENQKISKIWEDFKNNSPAYYALLEKINGVEFDLVASKNGMSGNFIESVQALQPDFTGLKCTLRSYQEFGTKYILHQGYVLLGDEMGLGKTVQAIAAMVAIRNFGENRFLVVCPASVLINWCRELVKHSDLMVYKLHGDDRDYFLKEWINFGGVAVTTYETLDKLDLTNVFNISMLVADEAHYVKNPLAERTKNLNNVCDKSNRVLFMTGTALENNVDEMCLLIAKLNLDVAKSVEGMKHLASAPMFREKISSVYLRRTREDVLQELPEMIVSERWCDMNEVEKQNYFNSTMSENFMAMRQVSWAVNDVANSSKANQLLEIYQNAKAERRKMIVFSYFLNTISQVKKMLGDVCYGPIDGSVPPKNRQEIIDAFSKGEDGSVLLAQVQAGGTGVNIQAASCVVLCEPQLKPSTENQAISRVYRMGQTRNVQVFKLMCEDSVDERIAEILKEKEVLFDNFADISVVGKQSVEIDAKASKNIVAQEKERLLNANKK